MKADRQACWAVPTAAALLLWPAVWNGYPIVFADTGTYLSQAVHRYLGWDRPPFYSLFMLPLHATVSTWPVIVAQALLTVWVVRSVSLVIVPWLRAAWLPVAVLPLAAGTWLPFLVCQLMPDIFTPLLVLTLGVLAHIRIGGSDTARPTRHCEERSDEAKQGTCGTGLLRRFASRNDGGVFSQHATAPTRRQLWTLTLFAAFAIAAQQSSLLLGAVLTGVLSVGHGTFSPSPCGRGRRCDCGSCSPPSSPSPRC